MDSVKPRTAYSRFSSSMRRSVDNVAVIGFPSARGVCTQRSARWVSAEGFLGLYSAQT